MPNQDNTTVTEAEPASELESAQVGYGALLDAARSIHLATVDECGQPEASYAPVCMDASRNFYVHVSELATHSWNLRATGRASVLVVEDEASCETIFARKRVSFDCEVTEIERHGEEWDRVMQAYEAKHGKMVGFLKTMEDFHLFRLTPQSGRLVLGFGKAYEVGGPGMSELSHIGGGNGGGHRRENNKSEA